MRRQQQPTPQRERTRCPTPPRISEHKPPKPLDPPPVGGNLAAIVSPLEQRGDGIPVSAKATQSAIASTQSGFMSKLGDQANVITQKRSWKRRFFVLDVGILAYYESDAAFEGGQPPIKGNRIRVSDYVMSISDGSSSLADGSDIILEHEAAKVLGNGSTKGAGGDAHDANGSPMIVQRLSAGGGLASVSSPRKVGQSGTNSGSSAASQHHESTEPGRVWKFRCESRAELDRWAKALSAHGCRPKRR